ncbi:MAG: sugar ABC transporter ATP-binding protein [Brevefilum sp.]|nr:sugar ABC transporter ATP-binding protein [Brevefilum sp.]
MIDENNEIILGVQGLTHHFPGIVALKNVNFDLHKGEIHALVGENGAGKSTMINIIAGVLQPSSGRLIINGSPTTFQNPSDAQQAGISVIFQEFNLVPQLSVAENIFINREPTRFGMIDWKKMNEKASEVLKRLKIDIDPRLTVSSLSIAQQQLTEIARGLAFNAQVIVMDEPTAALSEREIDQLLSIVKSLANEGVSVIYVSHKLEEVFKVADRITVLRDGVRIITKNASEVSEDDVIFAMVGRALIHGRCPERKLGPVVLSVKNLNVDNFIKDFSMDLHQGEVLGLGGLMGSGANRVIEALFGLRDSYVDELTLDGSALAINNPRDAIHSRIGYVPNDRKKDGLLPDLSVKHNISIGIIERLKKVFWIVAENEQEITETYVNKLNVRCTSINQRILNLSGGNQQKVILARSLAEECNVLLLSEPTRGVDVGAKAEIYSLIDSLVDSGMAVILQSSELNEFIRLANRVMIFSSGQVKGELTGDQITEESMMALATRV